MARRSNTLQGLSGHVVGAVVLLCAVGCEPSAATLPIANHPERFQVLHSEIARLSEKVTALESQLQFEQRNAARARQETQQQRQRIAALEAEPVVDQEAGTERIQAPSIAASMQAEAELRIAYRALMRAIERLDISAEEKAALKGSLRPTRSLDRENPWSVAKY